MSAFTPCPFLGGNESKKLGKGRRREGEWDVLDRRYHPQYLLPTLQVGSRVSRAAPKTRAGARRARIGKCILLVFGWRLFWFEECVWKAKIKVRMLLRVWREGRGIYLFLSGFTAIRRLVGHATILHVTFTFTIQNPSPLNPARSIQAHRCRRRQDHEGKVQSSPHLAFPFTLTINVLSSRKERHDSRSPPDPSFVFAVVEASPIWKEAVIAPYSFTFIAVIEASKD
ncbi:hypothetical protein BJ875DRAFT_192198 [Amylocarpus encephaloides]|uniref:Uncharacterized protein n=1 Tax=Amylocarpus encephaloides TaxID=45428 RepID=A0A9P7Y9C0_9HELO|nr:hypothetical protein BJ875DRAFT_192198 [Amylocarpus encephaloides]